jgi:diaphanous 2
MSFKKLSFVGGLRSSGRGKSGSFSQKMAITRSRGSLNEEDVIQNKDVDILNNFEILLENMNLCQEKKEPLRKLSMDKKIEMLSMNNKSKDVANKKDNAKTKLDSPSDYISYLSNKDITVSKISTCIDSLKVALTNNSLDWVQEFGNDGLKQVLNLISKSIKNGSDGQWEKIQLGCVKCLKSIMNNKAGLQKLP